MTARNSSPGAPSIFRLRCPADSSQQAMVAHFKEMVRSYHMRVIAPHISLGASPVNLAFRC
jgi:hypothetical protein